MTLGPGSTRSIRRRTLLSAIAAGIVVPGSLASCGVTRGDDSRDLLMNIPNSPGGGYDLTGRAARDVLVDDRITGVSITVDNVVGAGGANAMTSLMARAGDEHTLMTVGLGVVGSLDSFGSDFALSDATPLAQLISEPDGVLVPADSPMRPSPTSSRRGRPTRAVSPWVEILRPAGPTTSFRCSSPTRPGCLPRTSTT